MGDPWPNNFRPDFLFGFNMEPNHPSEAYESKFWGLGPPWGPQQGRLAKRLKLAVFQAETVFSRFSALSGPDENFSLKTSLGPS